jgi:hypothetical protein
MGTETLAYGAYAGEVKFHSMVSGKQISDFTLYFKTNMIRTIL